LILAGGMGKRMKSDLPKVLQLLNGKPLISYVIENLKSSGVDRITVIVGYRGQQVIDTIGNTVSFVWQHEQLGTGHAVMQAEESLKDYDGNILIACGDVPLIRPETFSKLAEKISDTHVKAVVLTMEPEEPAGYGRIVKDGSGAFKRIVEEKDASPEEKKIREVNSGTYIFHSSFLFKGLKEVNTDNAQGEYYLPDALQFILKKGQSVETLLLEDSIEGSGINSQEELKDLQEYINKGN
jgi:UDP-N-acetylglucosamine diphosphorylase/glucosamine-1-phosphate N-acetyltransferase